MYKKVKNSSLMNWFWFIIYILPLIFLCLFAINFYRDDDITINTEDLTIHCDNLVDYNLFNGSLTTQYIDYDNNCFSFTIEAHRNKSISLGTENLDYFNGLLYCFTNNNLVSSRVISNNDDDYFLYNDGKYSFVSCSINLMDDDIEGYTFLSCYNSSNENINVNVYFGVLDLDTKINYSDLRDYFLINTNNDSFDVILESSFESDLNQYLQQNFFNTFSHNGILYNMFINLFSYFGVFNIYIQIISVYLEYIVLISLIHLAFDILLLLPNICHKFMEKVGGERD